MPPLEYFLKIWFLVTPIVEGILSQRFYNIGQPKFLLKPLELVLKVKDAGR